MSQTTHSEAEAGLPAVCVEQGEERASIRWDSLAFASRYWPAAAAAIVLVGLFCVALSHAGWVPTVVALVNGTLVLAVALLATSAKGNARLDGQMEQLQDLHWTINENEERYRDLLDEQSDMIIRRDTSGRLTFVNRAFARTFDLDLLESLGSTFQPTVLAQDANPLGTVKGPRSRQRRVELVVTRVGTRWIDWDEHEVAASNAASGREIQIIGRDVTSDRLAAQELSEARDQAEAANRAKSRFLAAMSHEIRTPMNGILGMASLLIDTEQTAEQKTYTRAIDQSARNLVALIDEILDFSKIEAGKLVLASEPFSLAATIQSVVELFAASAQQKGLEIAWCVDPSADGKVRGDAARVRQIVLNLVSNAVKFTDRGGVVVKARRDGATTRLIVEDTGIGMSDDDKRNLFVEFEQADTAIRRRLGGTGLGLAISKRLARAMGGEIAISSTIGQGSTFIVDLALPAMESAAPEPLDLSMSVLLAFNRPIERFALYKTLTGRGIACRECSFEAAEQQVVNAAAHDVAIDRVIVELDADPVAAGRLLAKARAAAADPSRVRGLVLVNVLSRRNLSAFHREGFDSYLVSPVRVSALLEYIGAVQGPAHDPSAATQPCLRSLPYASAIAVADKQCAPRVLVAEDNDINALLATRVLEKCGCTVTLVRNGREAVDAVAAALTAAQPFDVIFMDIFMPVLDGLEAAAEIKQLFAAAPTVAASPIIALTANAFAEDRDRYLAGGMDDYLAKPFDLTALQAILARWTGRDLTEALPAA